MLINIWILFLFPIVWLWFEQTYVPQLLLHETQPERKQSSSSAALFPEHRAFPQLKEELLRGCAVPRHDTAVWHPPAIQWRATGDTLPAVSSTQWCPGLSSRTPQPGGISAPEQWWFKHQLCGSWLSPWSFPQFSSEQPCPVPTFGPTLKRLDWRLCDLLARQVVGHHIQPFAVKGFYSS